MTEVGIASIFYPALRCRKAQHMLWFNIDSDICMERDDNQYYMSYLLYLNSYISNIIPPIYMFA